MADQPGIRPRRHGGKIGVEGPDVQVWIAEADGHLPQGAQVIVHQPVQITDQEPSVRLDDVLRLEGCQLPGSRSAQGGTDVVNP